MESDDIDLVIYTWKMTRLTNIEYREQFTLDANDLNILKTLYTNIENRVMGRRRFRRWLVIHFEVFYLLGFSLIIYMLSSCCSARRVQCIVFSAWCLVHRVHCTLYQLPLIDYRVRLIVTNTIIWLSAGRWNQK